MANRRQPDEAQENDEKAANHAPTEKVASHTARARPKARGSPRARETILRAPGECSPTARAGTGCCRDEREAKAPRELLEATPGGAGDGGAEDHSRTPQDGGEGTRFFVMPAPCTYSKNHDQAHKCYCCSTRNRTKKFGFGFQPRFPLCFHPLR